MDAEYMGYYFKLAAAAYSDWNKRIVKIDIPGKKGNKDKTLTSALWDQLAKAMRHVQEDKQVEKLTKTYTEEGTDVYLAELASKVDVKNKLSSSWFFGSKEKPLSDPDVTVAIITTMRLAVEALLFLPLPIIYGNCMDRFVDIVISSWLLGNMCEFNAADSGLKPRNVPKPSMIGTRIGMDWRDANEDETWEAAAKKTRTGGIEVKNMFGDGTTGFLPGEAAILMGKRADGLHAGSALVKSLHAFESESYIAAFFKTAYELKNNDTLKKLTDGSGDEKTILTIGPAKNTLKSRPQAASPA
jgi:hypothetical protein